MNKVEKKLPKATAEVVREYDELQQKLNGLDPSWSDEEVNAISARLTELENNYDWFNVEFTDPATGKKGLKTVSGEIICPNILTGVSEAVNGIMSIESGDKCGVIDTDTYQCVLPEYDDLEIDAEADIVFVKGDKRGYVTEDKGEFVTVEQYETDENYIDVPVLATRLP